MQTIRLGDRGISVMAWENFLCGMGYYNVEVDGYFDENTKRATAEFQRANNATADGVVGPKTYAIAMSLGFPGVEDASVDESGPNWPPRPSNLTPTNQAMRERLFGKFDFVASPSAVNPEGITIQGDWVKNNIVWVEIPQLKGISGAPKDGRVQFHAKAAQQLQALWAAWEKEGLLPLVNSYAGSWVPRFIRGSRTTLSNHAYGSAFDINVPQNGLGVVPALVGKPGSVRKLVPTANRLGFFWGGHYGSVSNLQGSPTSGSGRFDGMHFEVAQIV